MFKYLLLLVFCFNSFAMEFTISDWQEIHGNGTYTKQEKEQANEKTKLAETNFRTLTRSAVETNLALRAIITIGVYNLRHKGHPFEAYQLESEWKRLDGKLIQIVQNRNIGDFPALSEFLTVAYDTLEAKLGKDICETLRLTDIKTINYCMVVVFRPCKYGYTNFYDHFVTDTYYKGLAPVVSYWATVITCDVASYGAGYFFICSPVGMLVERAVLKRVAPWLAPKLFDRACGTLNI